MEATGVILKIVVDGRPVPKKRPRVGAYGAVTPEATKTFERNVWAASVNARNAAELGILEVNVGVIASFYLVKNGNTLPDGDNCLKSILDGMNNCVYHDDTQVKICAYWMEEVISKDEERSEVFVLHLPAMRAAMKAVIGSLTDPVEGSPKGAI